MSSINQLYQALPSMHAILAAVSENKTKEILFCHNLPRPLLRESIDSFLDAYRKRIKEGKINNLDQLGLEALLPELGEHLRRVASPKLRRVINGTGVIIHTNLGRSLLPLEAMEAIANVAVNYSNLEFDLENGERGSRYSHVEELICRLTGAQSALVVNNNAAAVLLLLDTLCKEREVLVSRGELVEIGGSFRIPEVMEKSGCRLKEVGATNRTHLKDYQEAITESTAAILKVHTSNYRIIGFTREVPREELAELAKAHNIPLLEDLGSGALLDFAKAGQSRFAAEPTPEKVLAKGVDVVTFSGDKVLGGPQAGIIAGKKEYIERIKKNQLNRALRIDKLTLAALEATLRLYMDQDLAVKKIPTLQMMCMPEQEIKIKARRLKRRVEVSLQAHAKSSEPHVLKMLQAVRLEVAAGVSRTGGGAFPECDLPSWVLSISSELFCPDNLKDTLLTTTPPIATRVEDNALRLDARTIAESEFSLVGDSLAEALEALAEKTKNQLCSVE